MKVLSLFDGMSCGQIALNKIGADVETYYASELDKYAIKVTQANFPDTVQLGDVTLWRSWDIDWSSINLLIGGSPCQGFSFAGKRLAFDDPRSKLFFVYVDILNHIKKVNSRVHFMLENVRMKEEYMDIISDRLGVEPVLINSALVSAQNRRRYYWANWSFDSPEDRGVLLRDILEDGVVDREKSFCIDANYFKGGNLKSYFEKHRRQLVFNEVKTNVLRARCNNEVLNEKGYERFINKGIGTFVHEPCRVVEDFTIRKLTPVECERLQTVPDNFTNHVSNTQRYKMVGNGWTVDVVAHIFMACPLVCAPVIRRGI